MIDKVSVFRIGQWFALSRTRQTVLGDSETNLAKLSLALEEFTDVFYVDSLVS